MARNLPVDRPPRHAPGQNVAKTLAMTPQWFISEELTLAGGDVAIFNVPAGTRVLEIKAEVTEVWDGDAAITIGDGTDADGYMTDAEINTAAVGFRSSLKGAQPLAAGKLYTADDTIDLDVTSTTGTTGKVIVHILYLAPIHRNYLP